MQGTTDSEARFERFCTDRRLRFERVPEAEGRRPDYRLFIDDKIIVVEIKQFDPNKAESELEQAGSAIMRVKPGRRVKGAISNAVPQLRALAQGHHATLLILYNKVAIVDHTNEYFIKVAMFGLETLHFDVPRDLKDAPRLIERKFGGGKMTTPTQNTTISAIGVFSEDRVISPMRPHFSVYHNPYAAVPLPASILGSVEGVAQFELAITGANNFTDWKEIIP